MPAQQRLRRWTRNGGLAALGFLGIALVAFTLGRPVRERPIALTLTAGSVEGTRAVLARALVEAARPRGLHLTQVETRGSEEALSRVAAGGCDLALVQGGLHPRAGARVLQVAALHVEPLHLLVRPGLEPALRGGRLLELAGHRVNLGEAGSGTSRLARSVLDFAGLDPGRYVAETRSYAELMAATDATALPDAAFTVSTLPSRVARHLVDRHGYRLVELPFAEAFALSTLDGGGATSPGGADRVRREYTYDAVVPAYTYDVEPGVPPAPLHSIGTRLLLVARAGVPSAAVERLLDVVFSSGFAKVVHPPLAADLLSLPTELEPHPGTSAYTHRNQPLIAGDFVDLAEKWFSIAGVATGGAVCLWQWVRRRARWRRDRGFEAYLLKVAEIERRAAEQEAAAALDLAALLGLRGELLRLKQEAIAAFAAGELEGEAVMSGFLAHVSDTRTYLTRLILHERDNIEEEARRGVGTAEALWEHATLDAPSDQDPRSS